MPAKPTASGRRASRRFRLWGKKRGERQSGSSRWGGVTEALFFSGLFVFGVLALTELILLQDLLPPWSLWLSMLLLGAFILVGAVGAIYSVLLIGTSDERRADIARRVKKLDILNETPEASKIYPAVPSETHWTSSPGTRLKYRLPIESSPSVRLVFTAIFCLLWNGAVVVLAVFAFQRGELIGGSSWTFQLMVVGYAIVGFYSLYRLFRMLIAAAAVGPTSVEVSAQPMFPGREYRLYLAQSGQLKIRRLEVRLACDEEATFSDGTDTRSESRRVFDDQIFCMRDFEIVPSTRFEHECNLCIPASAMHSFVSPHNLIGWKIIVNAESHAWPPLRRSFPLVVYPHGDNLRDS